MHQFKKTKIALISFAAILLHSQYLQASTPFPNDKAFMWFTPTESALENKTFSAVGYYVIRQQGDKLRYCQNKKGYETLLPVVDIYDTNNNFVDTFIVDSSGKYYRITSTVDQSGSKLYNKPSVADVQKAGGTFNEIDDGGNCSPKAPEPINEIEAWSTEFAIEDCPAGQTVGGVENGRTRRIGKIPNYTKFSNDLQKVDYYLKSVADSEYKLYSTIPGSKETAYMPSALVAPHYDDKKFDTADYGGTPAFLGAGLVDKYNGTWQEGSEAACQTPSVQPEPIEHLQETRNIDCEAGESGYISQYRTYEVVNGVRQNESEWITNFNSCTKIAEPDYSVPLHFDHDQYIYEDCPVGQTVGGFDGGSIQRQGRVEIWSETTKQGEIKYSIKNLGNGAFTPINLDDYRVSEPPFFKMPSSFMYEYNGIWTPGFEAACKIPVTYTYEYQTRNSDCAAGQIGQITEQRMVRKGSDNSELTMIDWYTVMNSCQTPPPPKPEPQPEPEAEPEPVLQDVTANVFVSCPDGQTVGSKPNGETVRKGTIPLLFNGSSYAIEYYGYYIPIPVSKAADGSVFIDDFTEADVDDFGGVWSKGSEEACGVPVAFQQLTDWKTETVACQEGQAGHIKYDYNRTWEYDALNDVIRNDSGWISSVKENTCKTLEDALLEEEEVTKTEQCPSGQFGSITVKGKNVTYGLSGTKFIETDRINNCVAELDQFSQETRELECPAGQVGSISEYRIKATNNEGAESYPYGNSWLQASNTCANQVSADEELSNADNRPKGLLSSQTIKASDNSSLDKLLNYLNVVQDVNPSADYRLYLLIDRLDNLDTGKIEAVASKWKKVSGGIVILSDAPRFARSYIGFGGITKSNVDDFVVISADYQNGNIKVMVKEIKNISSGKPIVFNVPFAKI